MLERNWRAEGGELDLVVRRGDAVRLVEVKARDAEDPFADEAVTPQKQSRLRAAGAAWLHAHADGDWREVAFLVAWVDPATEPWTIRWLDDAFDGPP